MSHKMKKYKFDLWPKKDYLVEGMDEYVHNDKGKLMKHKKLNEIHTYRFI